MENPHSHTSPASQLLRLASNPLFDTAHQRGVEQLLHGSVDWTDILTAAQTHAVLPLVTRNLARVSAGRVPADVLRHLHLRHAVQKRRNDMMVAELARLVERFDAAGIDMIAYKGPVIAQLCYGDVNLRSFGDLDFLVRRDRLGDVRRVLAEDGYGLVQPLSPPMHVLFEEVAKEYCFVRGPIVLEPHWSITMPRFPFPLDYDGLWDRTWLWNAARATLRVFSPEDLLLVTCVIGAKGEWMRLQMVGDVAAVLSAFGTLDAEACLKRADETGTRRILLLGCRLAQALYDIDPPERLRQPLRDDPVVLKLSRRIVTTLLQIPSRPDRPRAKFTRLSIAMRERASDKVRYVWRSATTPTFEHMHRVPLPAALHGLYRVLVPLHDYVLKPVGKRVLRSSRSRN